MVGANYPDDWETIRRSIISDHLNRCANCHTVGGPEILQVHHVVPVGMAGSHRKSNLTRCVQTVTQQLTARKWLRVSAGLPTGP